jgi:hypothetical protein
MRGRARSTDARVRHHAEGQAIFRRVPFYPQQLDNPGSDALIDRDAACCFE